MTSLKEENAALRDMLAALRQENEALYDIFAAIGESHASNNWTVGYVQGIKAEGTSTSLLRKYAARIRAKDAPPDPPANAPRRAVDELPCAVAHANPGAGVICNSQDRHDGPDHVAWAADGREIARWPVDVSPDPDTCACGHLGYRHIFTGTSPCTQCECKAFGVPAGGVMFGPFSDTAASQA